MTGRNPEGAECVGLLARISCGVAPLSKDGSEVIAAIRFGQNPEHRNLF